MCRGTRVHGKQNGDKVNATIQATMRIIEDLVPENQFLTCQSKRGRSKLNDTPFIAKCDKFRGKCTYDEYEAAYWKPTNI